MAFWCSVPVRFWRIVLGPVVVTNPFWILWFLVFLLANSGLLAGGEYFAIKYFYIVIKKRVLAIVDDFWARYLLRINLCIGSVFSLLNCYTAETNIVHKKLEGLPNYIAKSTPFNFK